MGLTNAKGLLAASLAKQLRVVELRCPGQRWLKILWKMRQTNRPYDEALHTRNQVLHGSQLSRAGAGIGPIHRFSKLLVVSYGRADQPGEDPIDRLG